MGMALAMLLLLAGCSSTTFVYNRLDFILPWFLDDYVELNREQKASLDQLLKPFLRWHRVEELPQYVLILREMEAHLDADVTAESVAGTFSELERAWLRLEEAALNWLLLLGDQLSDRQIAEFLAVLQEQQLEYEEKYLDRSDAQQREDSYDDFLDGLQDYLGRLDISQRAVLKQASVDMGRMDGLWLEERAVWLAQLSSTLQRAPGWQQALRNTRDDREANYSPQYRDIYTHNLKIIQAAIASVINSRSPRQDRRLRKKLKNLREDFETLIVQADSE
jgi:hypothetical protein